MKNIPTIREGQQVRVTLEGSAQVHGGDCIYVNGQIEIPLDREEVVSVEVLPDPLKAGDTVDQNSPEPPVGTVILCKDGTVLQKLRDGRWFAVADDSAWASDLSDPAGIHDEFNRAAFPARVLYVPEGKPDGGA